MLTFKNIAIDIAQFKLLGSKRWQPLLNDVTIDIHPGELVALVGGSGEGKSLFLQNALGLLPDNMRSKGEMILNGQTVNDQQKAELRGKTICYVPQGVSALNPLIRIGPMLKRTTKLSGVGLHSHEMLHHIQNFKLQKEVINHYPKQLSGGMAKRVLVCNATLTNAKYILADEVTAWLDQSNACLLLSYLKKRCAQGCGILWVTHDLALAAKFAHRIAVLRHGTVNDIITPKQLQNRQASEWTLRLWDALPEQQFLRLPMSEN